MAERIGPSVYSIAAHRGFADALVAGLVPRYAEEGLGLARLTLLLPSTRAARTVTEAFIRHFGESGAQGMLMPRMAVVGDLDLDEALGSLLDPLGTADIPPAVDPTWRWLRLAQLLTETMGKDAPAGAALFRLARDTARTMDRLLVEDIRPEQLRDAAVLDLFPDLAGHWQASLRRFATVQAHWLNELQAKACLDAAARRNRLFDHAARRWKALPPATPIVAAGVTSAAPALARLLRVVADLPRGAVILPDLDLTMDVAVWDELGCAGAPAQPGGAPFAKGDAVTHPQYHLKLLLNRMGVARSEVEPWHRKGAGAARPERSHAVSAVFLPPEASKVWVSLNPAQRHMAGIRLLETPNPEAEAQTIALAVREALEVPGRRIAIITPDRALARRIVHHLRRWHIEADDSAGRPLSQTTAGRLFLLLAHVIAERAAPVALVSLLSHPMVRREQGRREWLRGLRAFERKLRGPRPAPGLEHLRSIASEAGASEWWAEAEGLIAPLLSALAEEVPLADLLDRLAGVGEALCGQGLWAQEDGRMLSGFVEELRSQARAVNTMLDPRDLHGVLSDAMEARAVRPPYGGHPRVAIYGLLEARMTRADLVICAGLNEGSWPARPSVDPLLTPPVLRALGVPGADFRIGLAAHDLAGALGAAEVILSRSERDSDGPAIASRFLLRVKALLGELLGRYQDKALPALARAIDDAPQAPPYQRPDPKPSATQRLQRISVTALDRLRSDPYQFYAGEILKLKQLDLLDAEPTPAWQGQVAHDILEHWHEHGGDLVTIANDKLKAMDHHPLTRFLWEPRLLKGLEWVESTIASDPTRRPVLWEKWGEAEHRGVTLFGRIDRLDLCEDGTYAVVDYKTGTPPSGAQVEQGFALQLGTLGLMVGLGGFAAEGIHGEASKFEYWSLAKVRNGTSATGFGYVQTPIKEGGKRSGIPPEDFLPEALRYLDNALDRWILGSEGFTARLNPDATVYNQYDQLMRLDEWLGREAS